MIVAIIVALLTLIAQGQICSPSTNLDKISTGAYTFSLFPFTSRLQCFNQTLDNTFANSKPQVALGISGIGNFQSDSTGLDFSLRSLLSPSNLQLSLILILNNGSWGSLTVSYLIAARPQFLLGNALSNGNLLATCDKQSSYPLTFSVSSVQAVSNTQSLGILILLSGLRTPSSLFNFQFTQPFLDFALRQINTSIITNATKQIQLLQIYYVIVDLSKFVANGYSYNFSLTSMPSDYSISGIVSINTQSLQSAFFAINRTAKLACSGFNCSTCQTAVSCLSLGGQVFGLKCVKCKPTQILVNGVCSCPNGQVLINETCQLCPAGTIFNALIIACTNVCSANQIWLNGACQCIPGYSLVNAKCQLLKCGINEYFYQDACHPCPLNSVSSSDQNACICVAGYTYISATSSCSLASSTTTTTNIPTSTNIQNSATNVPNLSSNVGGLSSATAGIYTFPGIIPNSNSFTTTSTSNTGSFFSLPFVNSNSPSPLIKCPNGAFYQNGTCRNQAIITYLQAIQFTGQNVIYAGYTTSNLPQNLSFNQLPNLIVAKLVNNTQNAKISIKLSEANKYQWIVSIIFTNPSIPLNVALQWNPAYSSFFTENQINYVKTNVIIPDQVPKISLTASPTKNLATNDDKLDSISQIAENVLDSPQSLI